MCSVGTGTWASLHTLALRTKVRSPNRRCARDRLVQLVLPLLLLPGRAPRLPIGLPVSDEACGCTRRDANAAVILRHTVCLVFFVCACNDAAKTPNESPWSLGDLELEFILDEHLAKTGIRHFTPIHAHIHACMEG